jgi:hypothetical protein
MPYLGQCRHFEGLGQELSPYFKAQTSIVFVLYYIFSNFWHLTTEAENLFLSGLVCLQDLHLKLCGSCT